MINLFEKEVKEKLQWSLKQWQEGGSQLEAMKRLINSIRFWNFKLHNGMKNENVILTLYKGSSRAYPKLQRVANELKALDKPVKILGYAKFKNRRFLSLSFQDMQTRNYVVDNLIKIDDYNVAYLHWVDEVLEKKITVDWLSDKTDLLMTTEYISKFMKISSLKRETTILDDGNECFSGRVVCRGQFATGVKIEEIPYFDVIDGLDCHIIVDGRVLKCFTCNKLGHKASQCFKAFCKKCKIILNRSHICTQDILHLATNDGPVEMDKNLEIQENILHANYGNNVSLFSKKDEMVKTNLFQNLTLDFSLNTVVGGENNVMEVDTERPDEFIADTQIKSKYINFQLSRDKLSSENVASELTSTREYNKYVTEQTSHTSPNFILEDTSSEESSSENEHDFLMDDTNWCIKNINSCAEVSRKLLQDSLSLLKPEVDCDMHLDKEKNTSVLSGAAIVHGSTIDSKLQELSDAQLRLGKQNETHKTSARKKKNKKRK